MRTLRLLSALLLAGVTLPQTVAAKPTPVVVAVDTSRSLSPDQLRATTDSLAKALEGLDADTPTGLVAFDDQARWIRPLASSPAEVARALSELTPQGNFTVLNDAIFLALREMPEGGVIVLATDGRDESSATTVEDVATRCSGQGIRLITVGSGWILDERTLRRMALLTDGTYAGRIEALRGPELAREIQAATAILESRAPAAAAETEPEASALAVEPALPIEPETAPVETARGFSFAGLPSWALGALALLALAALALWLWTRRSKTTSSYCSRCGSETSSDGTCDHCRDDDLIGELWQIPVASRDELREVTNETEAFSPLRFEERLEQTCVLEEQTVLSVKEPGQSPRAYSLTTDSAVSIGRESRSNTLALPDPTLSTQHFRLVPWKGSIYLVDQDSTNGCLLNGKRVRSGLVGPGDLLKAGQIEFAVKTRQHQLGWDTEVVELPD